MVRVPRCRFWRVVRATQRGLSIIANTVQRSNTARQTTAPQANFPEHFLQKYQSHLKHLLLKGLQPKTIDAYLRNDRRAGCDASASISPTGSMR